MRSAFRSPWALIATAALLSCGGEVQRVSQTPVPTAPNPVRSGAKVEQPAAKAEAPSNPPEVPAASAAAETGPSTETTPSVEAAGEFEPADRIAELANLEMQNLPLDEPQAEKKAEETAENAPEGETPADDEADKALIDEIAEINVPDDFTLPKNREGMLTVTNSELPLVLNREVRKYINYFSSRRGKQTFRTTMRRAGAYREMIERVLREEGVPVELFHLAQAESGFKPKARSYASAVGMWQFMSFRGRQYGLRQNNYLDERHDPEQATRAAARHLLDLYVEFGDWYLAMAAYNSGPLRVRRAIQRGGTRDFWTLCKKRLLPRQTRNYVPIILAMVYVGKNQDLYLDGESDLDPAPPLSYDTVETNSEIHLALVADITDSTVETLANLNPALFRSATPPGPYALHIPKGTADEFRKEIALIPADKRMDWRRHTVSEGETLDSIAEEFHVSKTDLLAVLDESNAEPFAPGATLTVPAPPQKIISYRVYRGAGGLLEGGTGRYRIARGDTLGSIARRFGTSVSRLKSWNGLANTRIRAGRYLIVMPKGANGREVASSRSRSTTAPRSLSGEKIRYRIRRGDSLGTIAARHGVSVSELKAWNGLRSNRIVAGKYLTVGSRRSSSSATRQTASSRSPNIAPGGEYRIRSGDTLGTISQRFGVTVSELKQWNGLRSSNIRAGHTLVVRAAPSVPATEVAESSGEQESERAAEEPVRATARQPSTGSTQYKIRRGDSLIEIAQRFDVTVSDLKAWNGLRSNRITAGKTLTIRGQSPPLAVASLARPDEPRRAAAVPDRAELAASSSAEAIEYTIRRGDSLAAIASKFGVSIGDLQAWNSLRGSRITAGDMLIIRPPETGAGDVESNSFAGKQPSYASADLAGGSPQRYQIRRGDTLAVIAARFGVTVRQLMKWNGLRNTRITAGRFLMIGDSVQGGG